MNISDQEFEAIVNEGIERVPSIYRDKLDNVAFIIEDEPSAGQRQKMSLRPGETLFGLYEGVPLPRRGGVTKILPDKITIFKLPLMAASTSLAELRRNVGHTIWHEVAHYFGLDHARIDQLDSKVHLTDT